MQPRAYKACDCAIMAAAVHEKRPPHASKGLDCHGRNSKTRWAQFSLCMSWQETPAHCYMAPSCSRSFTGGLVCEVDIRHVGGGPLVARPYEVNLTETSRQLVAIVQSKQYRFKAILMRNPNPKWNG